METWYTFIVPESKASRYLPSTAGTTKGGVARHLIARPGEPLFDEIGRLEREHAASGGAFFTAWERHWSHSREELGRATHFRVHLDRVFRPAGEECGTPYDDAAACPGCGSGGRQVGMLALPRSKVPRGTEAAATIAGEWLVSVRLAEILRGAGVGDDELLPIRDHANPSGAALDHLQLSLRSSSARLSPDTAVGENPFDQRNSARCSRGDLLGMSLLGPVVLEATSVPDAPAFVTARYVGVRRGLLRPRPCKRRSESDPPRRSESDPLQR
jgi:hypothetical protein